MPKTMAVEKLLNGGTPDLKDVAVDKLMEMFVIYLHANDIKADWIHLVQWPPDQVYAALLAVMTRDA